MTNPVDPNFSPTQFFAWAEKEAQKKEEVQEATTYKVYQASFDSAEQLSRIDNLESIIRGYLDQKKFEEALSRLVAFEVETKDLSPIEVLGLQILREVIRQETPVKPVQTQVKDQPLTNAELVELFDKIFDHVEKKQFREASNLTFIAFSSLPKDKYVVFLLLSVLIDYRRNPYENALKLLDVIITCPQAIDEVLKGFAVLLKADILRLTDKDSEALQLIESVSIDKLKKFAYLIKTFILFNSYSKSPQDTFNIDETFVRGHFSICANALMVEANEDLYSKKSSDTTSFNPKNVEVLELRCWMKLLSVCEFDKSPDFINEFQPEPRKALKDAKTDLSQLFKLDPNNDLAPKLQSLITTLDSFLKSPWCEEVIEFFNIFIFRKLDKVKLFEISDISSLLNHMRSVLVSDHESVESIPSQVMPAHIATDEPIPDSALINPESIEHLEQEPSQSTDNYDKVTEAYDKVSEALTQYQFGNYSLALELIGKHLPTLPYDEFLTQFEVLLRVDVLRLTHHEDEALNLIGSVLRTAAGIFPFGISHDKFVNIVKLLRAIITLSKDPSQNFSKDLQELDTYSANYLNARIFTERVGYSDKNRDLMFQKCEKALKQNPNGVEILELRCWLNLRASCFRNGKANSNRKEYLDAARADLDKILSLDPFNAVAYQFEKLFGNISGTAHFPWEEFSRINVFDHRPPFQETKLSEYSDFAPLLYKVRAILNKGQKDLNPSIAPINLSSIVIEKAQLRSVNPIHNGNEQLIEKIKIAKIYYSSGNYSEALLLLESGLQGSISNGYIKEVALLLKADLLRLNNRSVEAIQLIESLNITSNVINRTKRYIHAILLCNLNQKEAALNLLKRDDLNADELYLKGAIYVYCKDYSKGAAELTKALSLDPGHLQALILRCWVYLYFPRLGIGDRSADPKADLKRILEIQPTNEDAHKLQEFEKKVVTREYSHHPLDYDEWLKMNFAAESLHKKGINSSFYSSLDYFLLSERKDVTAAIPSSEPAAGLTESSAGASLEPKQLEAIPYSQYAPIIKLLEDKRYQEALEQVDSIKDTNKNVIDDVLRAICLYYTGKSAEAWDAFNYLLISKYGDSSNELFKQFAAILKADILRLSTQDQLKTIEITNEHLSRIARSVNAIILHKLDKNNRSQIVNLFNDSPQPLTVEELFLRGVINSDKTFWNEGIKDFDAVLQLDPNHIQALEYRCYVNLFIASHSSLRTEFREGPSLEEARKDLNRLFAIDPQNENALSWQNSLNNQTGKDPKIAQFLQSPIHKPLHFSYFIPVLKEMVSLLELDASKLSGVSSHRDESEATLPTVAVDVPMPDIADTKVDLPLINIDPKYLEDGEIPPVPRPKGISELNKYEWLKSPTLEFFKISEKSPDPEMLSQRVETDEFVGSFLSESGRLPTPNERCTFVMLGRKGEGRIPQEIDGGRVILVIPTNDLGQALYWVSSHTDVLMIESFKNEFIDSELGLVTSRRLAALSFAYDCNINGMLMIDDNLEKFYISEKIGGASQLGWNEVYQLFDAAAQTHEMTCVSARTFRQELDHKPNDEVINVNTSNLGSKIFFFELNKLKQKVQNPRYLFPTDPRIWGEDAVMQGAMIFAGAKVGTLSRDVVLFTRLKANRNLCQKVVKPANAWLSYQSNEDRPAYTLQAEAWLKEEVERNIEKNNELKLKVEEFDIGKIIEKIQSKELELRRKRTSHSTLPLDVLLSTKQVKVAKRRRVPVIEEIEVENIDSDDGTDFSGFIQEMAATWTMIERIQVDGQDRHRLRVGNKEIALQHPFRDWQLQALNAFGQFLQTDEGLHCYINAATAAGKTFIMAGLSAAALLSTNYKKNVLIVTPTIDLVQQTYDDCKEFYSTLNPQLNPNKLIKISNENASFKLLLRNKLLDKGGYCVIICANSLMNMLEADPTSVRHFKKLIVDELHEIPKKLLILFKKLAEEHEKVVVGFTATPENEELIGECIFQYASLEGVQQKLLCPWVVDKIAFPFSEVNLKAFYRSLPTILTTKKHPHGGLLTENKGIIYVRSIREAEELEKFLLDHHLKVAATHSKKRHNRLIIEEFNKPVSSSRINHLIVVDMHKIGFNGKVDFDIIARDDLSASDWIQIRGRALRNHAPTSWVEGEAPRQKIAYIMVFDGVELPQGFVLDFKGLALDQHYLRQDAYFAWSLRREIADVYEASMQPPSPALKFTFESLENRSNTPIDEKETVIIPIPYSRSPFEQAASIGALWHEQCHAKETGFDFNIVRAVTSKFPSFRQKLRARERDASESYTLVEEATNRLMLKAQQMRFEDVQKLYQIQVYQYDCATKHFAFQEKMGNPKSRQIIHLYKSTKRIRGPVVSHYDFLVVNPKF